MLRRVLTLAAVVFLPLWPLASFASRAPVVFYAEGTTGVDDAQRIVSVMESCGCRVDFCEAGEVCTRLPLDAGQLRRYSVVILSDVPARYLSPGQCEALDRYVRAGGSLLVVGGAHSLGASGWEYSPLALMLPVLVDFGSESRPVRVEVVDAAGAVARAVPWGECPVFAGINPVRARGNSSVVLADRESGVPLLAVREWGRGHVAVFSSDITAIWGADFNRWEHFPAFMGALLGCLAGPVPGMDPRVGGAGGAAAGAALPFVLGWVRNGLGLVEGWAERNRRWWLARGARYAIRALEEGTGYVRSLRLAKRMAEAAARLGRGARKGIRGFAVAETIVAGVVAYEDLPPGASKTERRVRAVNRAARTVFAFSVGVLAATVVPGPVGKFVVGLVAEKVAESVYDVLLSGRVEGLLLKVMTAWGW